MLRFLIALTLCFLIVGSFWGSRHFCDCTEGVMQVGWKGIERISKLNLGGNRKQHMYNLCTRICYYPVPVVDLTFGSPFDSSQK